MSALKYLFGEQAVSFRYAQDNYADAGRQELMEAILPANGTLGRTVTRFAAKMGLLSCVPYQQLDPNNLQIGDVNELGAIYLGHSVTVGTPLWIQPPHPRGDQMCDYDGACTYIQSMPYEMGYKGSQQLLAEDLQDPEKDDGSWRLPDSKESKQIAELIEDNPHLAALLKFNNEHYKTCKVHKTHDLLPLTGITQQFNHNYQHEDFDGRSPIRLVRTEKRLHLQAA